MTAITREFRLYTNAGLSIPPVIHVNQYDQGETWNFKLYQPNGQQFIPTDAAIVGVKADGNLIANAGTVSDGVAVITETEQMTAAPGKAVFEILFDGDTHGTANFVVLVEASPTNDGVASESDLSLFQEAIDSTSPAAIAQGVSDWMDEHLTPTTPVVDDTLTVQGAAADAKKTGDEIADLKSAITNGVPYEVKLAMDTIFQNVAFKNDTDYSSAKSVIHAWATSINVTSITAVYTQSGTVYDTDSLDSLKSDLVVTAYYDNGTNAVVNDYTLSGELTEGESTIVVAYGGKTTTFTVQVTTNSTSWILGKGFNQKAVNNDTYLTVTVSNARAICVTESADYEQLKNDTAIGQTIYDSGYYPIKIPDGCTGIEILPPADVYVAAYDLKYNSTIGFKWQRLTTTGWINPGTTTQFTFDSNATHFDLACKHGSAGTANVTESDVNAISIEYIYE